MVSSINAMLKGNEALKLLCYFLASILAFYIALEVSERGETQIAPSSFAPRSAAVGTDFVSSDAGPGLRVAAAQPVHSQPTITGVRHSETVKQAKQAPAQEHWITANDMASPSHAAAAHAAPTAHATPTPTPAGVYPHDSADYERLEQLYDALDVYTRTNNETAWVGDRLWSIASINLYNRSKTSFMFDRLRSLPKDPPPHVCELGFNGGHSALTFLESLPNSKVTSFDLGDIPWSQHNSKHLVELYKPRFTYVKGDSRETLPVQHGTGLMCDVLLIDGSKDPAVREQDLNDFRKVSHVGAKLFLDECNNFPCVSGQVDPTDPSCQVGLYTRESEMYNKLSREGLLKVIDCSNSPTAEDNLCFAEFAK